MKRTAFLVIILALVLSAPVLAINWIYSWDGASDLRALNSNYTQYGTCESPMYAYKYDDGTGGLSSDPMGSQQAWWKVQPCDLGGSCMEMYAKGATWYWSGRGADTGGGYLPGAPECSSYVMPGKNDFGDLFTPRNYSQVGYPASWGTPGGPAWNTVGFCLVTRAKLLKYNCEVDASHTPGGDPLVGLAQPMILCQIRSSYSAGADRGMHVRLGFYYNSATAKVELRVGFAPGTQWQKVCDYCDKGVPGTFDESAPLANNDWITMWATGQWDVNQPSDPAGNGLQHYKIFYKIGSGAWQSIDVPYTWVQNNIGNQQWLRLGSRTGHEANGLSGEVDVLYDQFALGDGYNEPTGTQLPDKRTTWADGTCGQIRAMPVGSLVSTQKIVTGSKLYADGHLEVAVLDVPGTPNAVRASGLMVEMFNGFAPQQAGSDYVLVPGDRVSIQGAIGKNNGTATLFANSITWVSSGAAPKPLMMNQKTILQSFNKALNSQLPNYLAQGTPGVLPLAPTGLRVDGQFVTIVGTVTALDVDDDGDSVAFIDDGTHADFGIGGGYSASPDYLGVMVIYDPALYYPNVGDHWSATGYLTNVAYTDNRSFVPIGRVVPTVKTSSFVLQDSP